MVYFIDTNIQWSTSLTPTTSLVVDNNPTNLQVATMKTTSSGNSSNSDHAYPGITAQSVTNTKKKNDTDAIIRGVKPRNRHERSSRTSFECHPDEVLEAIAIVSGLAPPIQKRECSNPQENYSSSRYHNPNIVETVMSELPPSATGKGTDILSLIDDAILRRAGHGTRPRRRRRRAQSDMSVP